MNAGNPTPVGLTKKGDASFIIKWDDGHESVYSGADLRRGCHCAACVNELTGERILKPESVPDDVKILKADLTGGYALTFAFSDGHGSGIYPYDRLRGLCPCCVTSS